jgi:hypothetical protein
MGYDARDACQHDLFTHAVSWQQEDNIEWRTWTCGELHAPNQDT